MSRVLPILFNTEMVREILKGRKTVTRRVIKDTDESMYAGPRGLGVGLFDKKTGLRAKEPPYNRGDVLYVRETWAKHPKLDKYYYRANSECDGKSTMWGCPDAYDRTANCELCEWLDGYIKWRPSIYMPKKAARIWLKVINMRVERLQDIRPEQVRSEGIKILITPGECKSQFNKLGAIADFEEKRKEFKHLWNSTIKDIGRYGWEANPWVWVIEFEQCERPEDS